MAEENIYVILAELAPMDGCQLAPAKVAGAAVRFYVPASDQDHARERLVQWATDECFRVVEIEWCVDYEEVEWECPDSETAQELISLARDTGNVVHGEFHVWPPDAPESGTGTGALPAVEGHDDDGRTGNR